MGDNHRKEHEEEGASEGWLLPYSDLMTLLLAVFIVLFAVSQRDTQKMEKMSQAFMGIFGGGTGELHEGTSPIDNGYIDTESLPDIPDPFGGLNNVISQQKEQQMEKLENAFKTYILENNLGNSIQTALKGNEITVTLASDILFPLGSAELTGEQRKRAQVIADIIAGVESNGYPIAVKVSGHTDNLAINTPRYPSNLSLSLDRATNFMAVMLENSGLDPRSFTAAGYGDLEPVDTNDTAEGRSHNRRVEIRLSYQSVADE